MPCKYGWRQRSVSQPSDGKVIRTSNTLSADLRKIIDADNDFGFRLLSGLAEQDPGKNVFISSFSVAMALAMTYNGADGSTKEALASLLGLTEFNLEQVNSANASLLSMQDKLDPEVQLTIANSIWVRLAPALSFVQQIREYYFGEASGLDFSRPDAADIINRWVAGKTCGKIQELVTPAVIDRANLVLINAIYFKGMWTSRFDKAKTTNRDFHLLDGRSQPCPMMTQGGYYDYYETDEFQAVNLPYGAGRISMYIFLPKSTCTICDFQKTLTSKTWKKWMVCFENTPGEIVLPRFNIEYGQDLLTGLRFLGGDAIVGIDFAGMGVGPLLINCVIHKSFVEVNEEGTEAAAATAVVMFRGMPPKRFTMTLDRPFFAAIRDNSTGGILFSGYILDPTQC